MKVQDIKKQLKEILSDLNKSISQSKNFEDIKQLKSKYLNKNETILKIRKSFHSLNDQDKKDIGGELKRFTTTVEEKLNQSRINMNKKHQEESISHINTKLLNIDILKFNKGSIHPLNIAADKMKSILNRLGYSFISPQEIETVKRNFDDLNIEKDHPSRDRRDTFYINEKLILRPHCTNMTAQYLSENNDEQIKAYTIGKTYRNDTDDATHSHQFQQIDIFNVSKNNSSSISNLKWLLTKIFEEFFDDKNIGVRFRPSYFPFTTPSYEVDMQCSTCKGKGCSLCKKSGWIEILGSGMLHPNVIKAAGKDPKEYTGFAIGIGLERLAMIKWNIEDIRHFYNNDIDFLKQFKT